MLLDNKKIRYIYWITSAFVKKNLLLLFASFLLSLLAIILILTFSPYILKTITTPKQIIGVVGEYTTQKLPDEVAQKISNGLIYTNEKGEIIPVLAQSWEILDNGKVFKFKLKDNLAFNDGEVFLSKNVNYKFKDVDVKIIDDKTIAFELDKPLSIFLQFLDKPIIKNPLIGVAGLYNVSRYKTEQGFLKSLTLSPVKSGYPILIYKFYDTEAKLLLAYKLGEIREFKTISPQTVEYFSDWKNTTIDKNVDYTKVMALLFNFRDQLLKTEKDLRHAIAESVDKLALSAYGEIALGPIPPNSWAYDEEVLRVYPFNPNVSNKIIKKYNTEATASANLNLLTFYEHLPITEVIKKSMGDAGVTLNIDIATNNLNSEYNLLLAILNISSDPDQYPIWHSTQTQTNLISYTNLRIDKLLEDGRETFSVSKRRPIYSDFQRILVDDMPAHFLYHPYLYTIKRR